MTFSKNKIDFDKIRSIDDDEDDNEDEFDHQHEQSECSDLIRKFVLDEETDNESDEEQTDPNKVRVQVHFQPQYSKMNGHITAGSQTDITALKDKSIKLRSWVSEPILDEFDGMKYKRHIHGLADWSTAVLLAEAEEFVRVGKTKFVTLSDWVDIKRRASYRVANNKNYA